MSKEKNKILVWLEDHTYHFGITKFIQELSDSKIYAIISANPSAKKFYQKQDLLRLEKSWYIRDSINLKNKNFDLSFLQNFEKKYDISIWKLVSGERFFNNYSKYHQFTHDEILSILEQEIKFYEKILSETKPRYLIMRIPEFQDIHLLYLMSKKLGITPLLLDYTRFGYRCLINSVPDAVVDFKSTSVPKNLENFTQLLNRVQNYSTQHSLAITKRRGSKKNFLKAGLKFLLSSESKEFQNYYQNLDKSKLNVFLTEMNSVKQHSKHKSFIDKNFLKSLKNNIPFIYFPLHFEPEQTTLIKTPYYTNQIEVITNIAKSLPIEFSLFVKEHPAMRLSGWRKISEYKKILKLPNVQLIHPSLSNSEIIPKSSLVITISGTSGLEAAFYKKPSIIFTKVNYSNLSSVYLMKNWQELPDLILDALNTEVNLSELNQYVNHVESISFPFDAWGLEQMSDDYFAVGGFLSGSNLSIESMSDFLEKNKSTFTLLASEHLSKIN
ncbi:Capsule polysaccharide biosynthesis protein [Marine Group I thaumarchaeote SCGC AAA799-E16]|uniref:Capsule polysaccharide biosynthesis protein n=2 Tax=Marine Group I TaxID=905826 RepID=A0A087S254_9ARCH|nr:Capsule polysaccharide biosynthesis protein [Marine Group I thaumarchaeote SCGC AAA799-E16]KFM19808.1 Capsule polysaccharide biosynthesis protein [Marine Group I thaumarchaeote SCGC RSA3]